MKIIISRKHYTENYTIGEFYIDLELLPSNKWEYICDTLEDAWRDILNGEEKIYGKTCIPSGQYAVKYEWSNHFNRKMPHILDVPQFDNVMIHPGNDENDTLGCVLVGLNDIKGKVINSAKCFAVIEDLMKKSGQNEWTLSIIDLANKK